MRRFLLTTTRTRVRKKMGRFEIITAVMYFLAFLTRYSVVKGCKCIKLPLHEAFCEADFVLLVEIKGPVRIQYLNHYVVNYDIEVKKIFKQDSNKTFLVGGTSTVITPRTASMCNAHMKKHLNYLIGGHIKRNKIYITSCGLMQLWLNVPKHIRRSLRKAKLNCDCSVTGCYSDKCVRFSGAETQTNKCRHFAGNFERQCYEDNGVCVMNEKGQCAWSKVSLIKIKNCTSKVLSKNLAMQTNNEQITSSYELSDNSLLKDVKEFTTRLNQTMANAKDKT